MLTESQTDTLVSELAARISEHAWPLPEHAAENWRAWLQRGARVVHVGREVIGVRTWTGSILREFRDNSRTREANEEFPRLVGEPVVDEEMRLIAQTGDGLEDNGPAAETRQPCPVHDRKREVGCNDCGLPVIERIVFCGCPLPRAWIRDERGEHYNHRFITGQIDHVRSCPGYTTTEKPKSAAVMTQAEIVRPKSKKPVKREVVSLALDLAAAGTSAAVMGEAKR